MKKIKKNKKKLTTYCFPAIVEYTEDGWYVISCPDLQGCHTQGKTYEEAIENIKDVISLIMEDMEKEEKNELTQPKSVIFTNIIVDL